ncbi:MAG TPA: hypothetical protein VGF07_01895 [Stellaceae bacterium]|jgi:hypothetical protein
MQAKYTRLYVDEQGESRFEDCVTELQPGFSAPGVVTPGFSAPFQTVDGSCFWIGVPSNWKEDWPHTAPRRMILVTAQGSYEVTTSTGIVRKFSAGSVVVVEDTSGAGHLLRITGTQDVIIFGAGLLPS